MPASFAVMSRLFKLHQFQHLRLFSCSLCRINLSAHKVSGRHLISTADACGILFYIFGLDLLFILTNSYLRRAHRGRDTEERDDS